MKLFIAALILLALMPCTGTGSADTIYQYTDKDGIRRFSDTPPQTDQQVKATEGHTAAEPRKYIEIKNTAKGGRKWISIENRMHAPVEVELSFKTLTNLTSHPPLPKRFVVEGRSELDAVELRIIDPGLPSPYRYRYRFKLGRPGARHAPGAPYLPPFKKGQAYKVSQAFSGAFSHNKEHSRFAVDIVMPVGTPILASRAGKVVVVIQQYVFGGLNKDYYYKRINGIRILHADGTMAFYGHIKRNSAQVSAGDGVEAGQVIAESGNTGYSGGPHLHFVIQKNEDMRWKSVPFEFKGPNGSGITPTAGKMLRAM